MKTLPALPHQPEWRHLSALFPQIERIEGSRAQALIALALFMDEKQAICKALSVKEIGEFAKATGGTSTIELVRDVQWVKWSINPEESSATGIATFSYRGRAKGMRRRDSVLMEGIQLVQLEVDRRWPLHKGNGGTNAKPVPSVETVQKFLEVHADGTITKADCKVAAERNFGVSLPEKNIWLPAWRLLSDSKKVKRGIKPKGGKSAVEA